MCVNQGLKWEVADRAHQIYKPDGRSPSTFYTMENEKYMT